MRFVCMLVGVFLKFKTESVPGVFILLFRASSVKYCRGGIGETRWRYQDSLVFSNCLKTVSHAARTVLQLNYVASNDLKLPALPLRTGLWMCAAMPCLCQARDCPASYMLEALYSGPTHTPPSLPSSMTFFVLVDFRVS